MIFSDSELTDASDFVLAPREIPREKNGYFDLENFTGEEVPEEVKNEIERHLSGEEWDSLFVEATLTEYAYLYEAVKSAAQKPFYQDPRTVDPSEGNYLYGIPDFYAMTAVKVSNLKALALMKEGQGEEAFEQAYYAVELGAHMEDAYGTLLFYMIGSVVKEKGIETLSLLTLDATDDEILRTYAQKLSDVYPDTKNIQQAYKVEYNLFSSIFEKIDEDPRELDPFMDYKLSDIEELMYPILKITGWSFYYHPHETQNFYSQKFSEMIEALSLQIDLEEDNELYPRGPSAYFTENAFGLVVLEGIIPRLMSKERREKALLFIENTQNEMLYKAQTLEPIENIDSIICSSYEWMGQEIQDFQTVTETPFSNPTEISIPSDMVQSLLDYQESPYNWYQLSSGGDYFAYTAYPDLFLYDWENKVKIHLLRFNMEEVWELYKPIWSPKDSKLALVVNSVSNCASNGTEVVVVQLDFNELSQSSVQSYPVVVGISASDQNSYPEYFQFQGEDRLGYKTCSNMDGVEVDPAECPVEGIELGNL